MNKIKAVLLMSCALSLNAIAQNVPVDSFKPSHEGISAVSSSKNSVTTGVSVPPSAQTIAPIAPVVPQPVVPQVAPAVSAPNVGNAVNHSLNVPNNSTDIQVLSAQSNEEYMKRRNSTFEGEMNKCINEIPKNAKGQRSSEALIKCANANKNQSVYTPNTVSKPSYLTDVKTQNAPVQSTSTK